MNRDRLLDLCLGCLVGVFATGAASMLTVNSRLAAVETTLVYVRRDIDRLSIKPAPSPTISLTAAP